MFQKVKPYFVGAGITILGVLLIGPSKVYGFLNDISNPKQKLDCEVIVDESVLNYISSQKRVAQELAQEERLLTDIWRIYAGAYPPVGAEVAVSEHDGLCSVDSENATACTFIITKEFLNAQKGDTLIIRGGEVSIGYVEPPSGPSQ